MRWFAAGRILLGVLILGASASAAFAEEAQLAASNFGRGPLELEDQFPLALSHLSLMPESPEVLPSGESEFRLPFAWTNTINRKRGSFLVDAEIQSLYPELRFSPVRRLELGLTLPVVSRGGGVLDSFIYNWHQAFGLPQGPRDDSDLEQDQYLIEGNNTDGGSFSQHRRGTLFGDLLLSTKFLLTQGGRSAPAASILLKLKLPTGAEAYAQEAVDLGLSALFSKRFGLFVFYGGAGYTYFGDTVIENVEYVQHRASGFLSGEWQAASWISLIASFSAASRLIESIEHFPNYALYLDLGGKLELKKNIELELMIRENPAPNKATADVTFYAGLACRL